MGRLGEGMRGCEAATEGTLRGRPRLLGRGFGTALGDDDWVEECATAVLLLWDRMGIANVDEEGGGGDCDCDCDCGRVAVDGCGI